MEIAEYTTKYAPVVFGIFASYPELFPQAELKILKGELSSPSNPKNYKFIAIANNKIVGFISLATCYATDYSWQVNWLAVRSECRQRGVGTSLLSALFLQAKKIRLKRIFVETCSCERERPARAFYEKNGFQQIALIPEFYGANHSKVTYQKELD